MHWVDRWMKAHDLLVEQKIRKDQLEMTVRESGAMLRDGFRTFFDELYKHSIPLVIFSAGIRDVLEEIIRQAGVFHPSIKVVSNYMDFDENGVLRAFKGELIHTYNKQGGALKNSGLFNQQTGSQNIILLADSMGDLSMVDRVENVENIRKIGYLNDKVDPLKPNYLKWL
ncbi:cytosolic 5'-nucleotidase 3-like [Polyodon spathula]|uniref:cytosolic 5'-nucleotidase 3-like n=1 Tax=Polyodon spathula TaxID=7913 RepID=UPI001B7F473B|nr:cytosolic 5'-nucleotidase 3-like [Polyodon spathula]